MVSRPILQASYLLQVLFSVLIKVDATILVDATRSYLVVLIKIDATLLADASIGSGTLLQY